MELKEQKYVVTLADTGNLTKAAGILNISQPALSLYIKNLELQLEENLFTRENRRLKPTYFGEMYINKARKILKIGDEFRDEMNVIKNGSKGRVTVGIPSWRTSILLPKILPAFKEDNKDIDVEIVEDSEAVLHDLLKQGKIDFYIGTGSRDMTKGQKVGEDKILLAASEDNETLAGKAHDRGEKYPVLKIADIRNENFTLVAPESRENHLPFNINEAKSFRPDKVSRFQTIESALTLVKENMGVTLIPDRRTSNMDLSGINIYQIDSKEFTIPMEVMTLSKSKQNPFAVIMIGMIENLLKEEK